MARGRVFGTGSSPSCVIWVQGLPISDPEFPQLWISCLGWDESKCKLPSTEPLDSSCWNYMTLSWDSCCLSLVALRVRAALLRCQRCHLSAMFVHLFHFCVLNFDLTYILKPTKHCNYCSCRPRLFIVTLSCSSFTLTFEVFPGFVFFLSEEYLVSSAFFCSDLPEKVSFSFLKKIFFLPIFNSSWQLFSVCNLRMSFHCLLTHIVSVER